MVAGVENAHAVYCPHPEAVKPAGPRKLPSSSGPLRRAHHAAQAERGGLRSATAMGASDMAMNPVEKRRPSHGAESGRRTHGPPRSEPLFCRHEPDTPSGSARIGPASHTPGLPTPRLPGSKSPRPPVHPRAPLTFDLREGTFRETVRGRPRPASSTVQAHRGARATRLRSHSTGRTRAIPNSASFSTSQSKRCPSGAPQSYDAGSDRARSDRRSPLRVSPGGVRCVARQPAIAPFVRRWPSQSPIRARDRHESHGERPTGRGSRVRLVRQVFHPHERRNRVRQKRPSLDRRCSSLGGVA